MNEQNVNVHYYYYYIIVRRSVIVPYKHSTMHLHAFASEVKNFCRPAMYVYDDKFIQTCYYVDIKMIRSYRETQQHVFNKFEK